MKTEKKYIKEVIENYLDLFDGILLDNLSTLNETKKGEGFKNLKLGYAHDHDSHSHITGERLETDKEFEQRVTRETKAKVKLKEKNKKMKLEKEARERKTLARLTEKYGSVK